MKNLGRVNQYLYHARLQLEAAEREIETNEQFAQRSAEAFANAMVHNLMQACQEFVFESLALRSRCMMDAIAFRELLDSDMYSEKLALFHRCATQSCFEQLLNAFEQLTLLNHEQSVNTAAAGSVNLATDLLASSSHNEPVENRILYESILVMIEQVKELSLEE